jgi:hypothetical protein
MFKIYYRKIRALMQQRAIVRFLTFKKLSARDITAELEGISGREALFLLAFKVWRKRAVNGRIMMEDDSRSERPP